MTKTNAFPSPCLPPLLDFNTFPFGAGWRNWGTRYSQNATRIESTSVIGSGRSRGRAAAVTPIFGGAFKYGGRRSRFSVRQQHFDRPRETNQICCLLGRKEESSLLCGHKISTYRSVPTVDSRAIEEVGAIVLGHPSFVPFALTAIPQHRSALTHEGTTYLYL